MLEATHGSLFAAPIRMILTRDNSSEPLRMEHVWFAQNLTDRDYERFAQLVGCRPRQLYGMTETGPAVLIDTGSVPVPATIGTALPGCAVRLGGAAGDELQVDGVPGRTLFLGYLDNEKATSAALTPSAGERFWFSSGDRATSDGQGRYTFRGRGGDIIKVGGENVSLTEVEMVLAEHPALRDVVAIGLADPVLDEVVAAVCVAVQPENPSGRVGAVRVGRRSALALPASAVVHIVPDLPRTSVGKVKRFDAARLVTRVDRQQEVCGPT